MKKAKSFDCVEMKDAIHAQLRKEHEGLDEAEIARRRRKWLETSDSPVAMWWRSMRTATQRP
jgi:hypothetical protein